MLIPTMGPLALALALVGCVDQPVLIAPLGGGPPADRLSALGLFTGEPSAQVPAAHVVPYEVIAPLWSDGASKHRFVVAPVPIEATQDHWRIPVGTYLVKTFYFPRDERDPGAGVQLVETRVIAFADGGAETATYVWNAEQTDAIASGGNLDVPIAWIDASGEARRQIHHVPGTTQCNSCHKGDALGMRSPQLAEQLDRLVAERVVDDAPSGIEPFVDPYGEAALEDRALSYLDVNCAHCHRPGGEAEDTRADWRRDHALGNICRNSRHGLDGRHRIIDPGAADDSVTIARMRSHDPFIHMPRGPSHVIDERALAMLTDWIASLPRGCP
jgi:mono/diheme cytochrome c family protein